MAEQVSPPLTTSCARLFAQLSLDCTDASNCDAAMCSRFFEPLSEKVSVFHKNIVEKKENFIYLDRQAPLNGRIVVAIFAPSAAHVV